jgi:hypothetical protein
MEMEDVLLMGLMIMKLSCQGIMKARYQQESVLNMMASKTNLGSTQPTTFLSSPAHGPSKRSSYLQECCISVPRKSSSNVNPPSPVNVEVFLHTSKKERNIPLRNSIKMHFWNMENRSISGVESSSSIPRDILLKKAIVYLLYPVLRGFSGIKELGEFVAGMWAKALPLWLAWEVYGSQLNPDPAVYVAPSWSWIQIMSGNQIEYAHCGWKKHGNSNHLLDIKLSILDVHCDLTGTDPSGTIKSGYIDVLGPVVEVTLVYNFSPLLGQRGSLVRLPPFSIRRGDLQTDFTCDCQDRVWINAKEGQDVVLLLVYVDGEKCCLLVLMEKPTGEYVRIGIAVREHVSAVVEEEAFGREWPIWDTWFRDAEEREIKIV